MEIKDSRPVFERRSKGKTNQTYEQQLDKPNGDRQEILIRRSHITYNLGREAHFENREEWLEEAERSRFYEVEVCTRQAMTVTTVVTTSKDRWGNIRLWGDQGIPSIKPAKLPPVA